MESLLACHWGRPASLTRMRFAVACREYDEMRPGNLQAAMRAVGDIEAAGT